MRVSSSIGGEIPTGWLWKETMTLLAPDGTSNVIASSEPLPDGVDAAAFARSQGELLYRTLPAYAELDFSPSAAFGTPDGFVRTFEWAPPEGQPVTQVQIYAVVGNRAYTATATAEKQSFPAARTALLEVLRSVVARPPLG